MDTETAPFLYLDLEGSHSTRVIYLEPSQDDTSELQCELAEIPLDSPPDYWALSYAWDAEFPSTPIRCSNNTSRNSQPGVLYITPNCAAALQQIRETDERRILWVDSICINQSNTDEKSRQVALMGDIYKGAARVIVWLGSKDSGSEKAIQLLKQFFPERDPESREDLTSPERQAQLAQMIRDKAQSLLSGVRSASEDPLSPLFMRSWFNRMWTVQEVALPPIEKVFVCSGDVTIAFSTMIAAIQVLGQIEYRWGRSLDIMRLPNYLSTAIMAHRYPQFRELVKRRKPGFDISNKDEGFLSKTLLFSRSRLATNPKDKVFALYGILTELGCAISLPDYRKTVEEIYTDVTRACIEFDKNIMVLYYQISDTRRSGLPSWVPDWNSEGFTALDSRSPVILDRFAAAGGVEGCWEFPTNPLHLKVFGKFIDSVVHKTEYVDLGAYDLRESYRGTMSDILSVGGLRAIESTIDTFRKWVELSSATESSVYPNGESIKEALQRTIVNDTPDQNAKAAKTFESWYRFMTQSPGTPSLVAPTSIAQNLIRTLLSSVNQTPVGQPSSGVAGQTRTLIDVGGWNFHAVALSVAARKSFYRTSNGYFGTAPEKIPEPIQPGDRIALVAGLSMPVLLRQTPEGYRLISYCYLHGCMYGEAWPENDSDIEEINLV